MSIEPRRVPTPFLPEENAQAGAGESATGNSQPAFRGQSQSFVFETPRSYQEPRPLAAALPEGAKSDLWELASTALNETLFVENINARDAALAEAVGRVRKQVYDETGVSIDDLPDPFVQGIHGQWGDLLEAIPSFDQGARSLVRGDMLAEGERNREAFNQRLAELKLKYPDKNIPASLEDAALDLQREIYAKAEDARARAPGGVEAFAGGLAGSLVGSFGDPLQVATLPIGMSSRTIVGAMVKEAAVNAGITGGLELVRDKAAWKDVTGREYTAADLFERMTTAAAFGGLLGAGGKTLQQTAGRVFFDRSAFEVMRTKYDALPADHPFRQEETFRRAMDEIGRAYREADERPAGTTADADTANRAAAARAAAEPDAPAPPDPVRDELVAMLDAGADAETIWSSQAARDADAAMVGQGSTMGYGDAIPEDRVYHLPGAGDEAPRTGTLDDAVDWLGARAAEAAGPEGVAHGRRAIVVMGYTGAGKSTFIQRFARAARAAVPDADLAKTIVPGYDGGAGSQVVHIESVKLRELALQHLIDTGGNFVLETVGVNGKGLARQMQALRDVGYQVDLVHVRVDPDEAVRRSWRRFLDTGRSIQPAYARSIKGKLEGAWDDLVDSDVFSGYLDIDYSGARADAKILPVNRRTARTGDGRGPGEAGEGNAGLLDQAQGARGIPDLEAEVGRIAEAARLAEQPSGVVPPPTSPAAVFDSTLAPEIARAADDPTDANIAAAIEAIERETAAITGEGVDDDGNPVAFSFGGRNARTANQEALAFAEDMARSGRSRDEIWAETWDRFGQGWFQGLDGKWRFEIDDRPVRIRATASATWDGRLKDYITDADAGGAYPQLKRIRTDRAAPWQRDSGFAPGVGITFVGRNGTARRSLLHERQHAIQVLEGFAYGTSPYELLPYRFDTPEQQARWDANVAEMKAISEAVNVADLRKRADVSAKHANSPSPRLRKIAEEARIGHNEGAYLKRVNELEAEQAEMLGPHGGFLDPYNTYRIYAGEVEARNVETRSRFTPAQRRAQPPWTTEDTPEALQFVAMEGDDAFSSKVAFSAGVNRAKYEPIAASAADDLRGKDPSAFADIIKRTGYAAYRLPPGTETARLPKGFAVVWHSTGAYAMSERNIADRMRAGQANFARLPEQPAADVAEMVPQVVDPPASADAIREVALVAFGRGASDVFDIAPAPKWAPEGAKAYTVKKTGRIVLIEGRVTAAEVPGLVLHEIGAHAGLQSMLGEREWSKLLDTAMKRAEAGKGAWAGVLDNIPADTPLDMRAEEALGYFLEQNVDGLQQHGWWRELVQRVRAWASKALPWLTRELSDSEIRDMAIASVRERARRIESSALNLAENLEPMPGDTSGRIFGPGTPDAAGFITSAERAFVNLPKKFAGAKSLTPDQWRSAMKAAGASAEAMRWQVEPALVSIGKADRITREAMEEALARVRMAVHSTSAKRYIDGYEDYVAPGKRSRYRHEVLHFGEGALGDIDYKSHNWETIPNAVGHIRMTDRKLAGGGKSLHVEELQSDLHQEAAQFGYKGEGRLGPAEQLQVAKDAYETKHKAFWDWGKTNRDQLHLTGSLSDATGGFETANPIGAELKRELEAAHRRYFDLMNTNQDAPGQPPRAPMESWEEPFVRHVLQLASREGYDTVTFPTLQTLHEVLQTEGTEKFYDERLPKTLARVAKSLGLQVETAGLNLGKAFDDVLDPIVEGMPAGRHRGGGVADVPAIRLTPEARGQLLNGVVAYSQGSPTGRAQPAPPGSAAAEPKKPAPGQAVAPQGPPSPELVRQRWLDALAKRNEKKLRLQVSRFRNGSGERDIGEFLLAVLDYQGQGKGLDLSLDGLRKAISARSMQEIEALTHHFRAGTLGRRVNKADLDNFVKEMFGEDTKDPAAKALAQATGAVLDKLRQRYNNAGGMIGKLERWGLPQAHNALAMRNWIEKNGGKVVGREALRKRLYDSLDVTRIRDVHTGRQMSATEVWDALEPVIEDILTDGWATRTPSRSPATPGMLANRRADHRFLIFKNATSWLSWQREFGQGDPMTAIVGHVERMARDIAAMEILGPNPDTTIEWLKQMAQHQAAQAAVGRPAALPARVVKRKEPAAYVAGKVKRMDEMWQNYTGAINVPVNERLARNAAVLRNLLTSATLGSAILSAMPTDPVFQAFARSFAGTSHAGMLKLLVRQTKNPREAAQLMMIMDHVLATFGDDAKHARELAGGSRTSVLAGQVLATSGLTPWTRGGRQVFQMGFLADMGNLAGDGWADLPKAFKRTFERYGINEPEWDVIRQSPLTADGFMTPQNITDHAGLRMSDRVLHMILQETEYAVPSGTLRSRSFMRGLDRSGTFMGELRQSGRMFLSFSATLPMLYGYRLVHQFRQGRPMKGALYFGALAGTLMFGGAIAMQMKNIRDGKDVQDMSPSNIAFWQAAFLQGGGLGIYGDFLFSNLNRMDRSIGETIAGPAVGFLSDAQEATLGELRKEFDGDPDTQQNIASTVGRLILGNVPGSSLWYFKGAYDRWVEDAFQRLVDPKADEKIRRQARKLQTSTGQGYWWSRTGQPSRAPEVAEAPQ